MRLNRSFKQNFKNRFEAYDFEVGILDDGPHYQGVYSGINEEPDLKTYAGGPARKQTREPSGLSIAQVFIENMDRIGVDLLRDPFRKKSSDIMKFTKSFIDLVMGRVPIKRVENLVQAIVRNPILRQDYGPNEARTADAKGFDRHLIDTSQMFRALKARARKRR